MFRSAFAVLIFACAYAYAYVNYIHPTFEYASYFLEDFTKGQFILSLFFAVLPVFGSKITNAPSRLGAVIVYVILYVPGQLTLLFMWQRQVEELILLQFILMMSMYCLFIASKWGFSDSKSTLKDFSLVPPDSLVRLVRYLTILSIVILVLKNYQNMRFVSFADVYELRAEAAESEGGFFDSYMVMWLTYCFLPFFYAKAFITKNLKEFFFGAFGSLMIYMTNGAKMAILLGIMIFGVYVLISSGKQYLNKVLTILISFILIILLAIPNTGFWVFFKSIVLVRVLAVGGWTISTYYEYFTANDFTYFTHIGPIQSLLGSYPYGEYSLGQVIGIEYSGSATANFNASFWASDGIAALGLIGIPVITIVVCILFYIINRSSRVLHYQFITIWLSGFWFASTNLPLSVALLSGGGIVVLFLLWTLSKRLKLFIYYLLVYFFRVKQELN